MWPKILMQYLPQLVELLPHVSRVVPMADKYMAQRGANDVKLDALAEGIRGDLGKVAKAHIILAEQLDVFAADVSESASEARRARVAAELAQKKAEGLEKQVASLRTVLIAILVVVALVLLLVVLAFALAVRSS